MGVTAVDASVRWIFAWLEGHDRFVRVLGEIGPPEPGDPAAPMAARLLISHADVLLVDPGKAGSDAAFEFAERYLEGDYERMIGVDESARRLQILLRGCRLATATGHTRGEEMA